jgi:[ribosomal protein S18]-alanine N-acetyltransferase
MITSSIKLTTYTRRHRRDLMRLLQYEQRLHIHLDWTTVDEWISDPDMPIVLAWLDEELVGAIASSPPIEQASWLRLLAIHEEVDLDEILDQLWGALRAQLTAAGVRQFGALVLRPWLQPGLERLGFGQYETIVTLRRQGKQVPDPLRTDIQIRSVDWREVSKVIEIDHAAFGPLWRLTAGALRQAARISSSFAVAELDHQIIGYQLSTLYRDGLHLARLATLPDLQGKGVGGALLGQMIAQFVKRGVTSVTVNTQQSNLQSQRLYQRYGFEFTGLDMDVWTIAL